MAFYTFTIEGFHIDNTRSRFDDTDQVSGVLRLGNETLPAQFGVRAARPAKTKQVVLAYARLTACGPIASGFSGWS